MVKVENMTTSSGNSVKNQFVILDTADRINYLQSYNSIIVKIDQDNKLYLDAKYWNYSTTTSKYRNMYLHETRKETEKKIESGEYILIDLN